MKRRRPQRLLGELAEFAHIVTRLKLVPETAKMPALSEVERVRGAEFAQSLSHAGADARLAIAAKGTERIKDLPRPLAAADMISCGSLTPPTCQRRTRLCAGLAPYRKAELRQPLIARARAGWQFGFAGFACNRQAVRCGAAVPQQESAEPGLRLTRFEDVVAQAAAARDIQLKIGAGARRPPRALRGGAIEFALVPGASPQLAPTWCAACRNGPGGRWMVAISSEARAAPSSKGAGRGQGAAASLRRYAPTRWCGRARCFSRCRDRRGRRECG